VAARILICLALIPVYFKTKVFTKSQKEQDRIENWNGDETAAKYFNKTGVMLYSALPLQFYSGWYRVISVKSFSTEVGFGLLLDLCFNIVPLIYLQGLNNSNLARGSLSVD